MEESVFRREKTLYESEIINMVISARFISIKNIPLVIKSLKHISTSKPWQLTLLGSGPDKELILETIKKEGCENRVNIISTLPREKALDLIVKSDIFIFPSLKEGGTWALMEAMAMGLPVVCLNWTGMAVETTPETAVQINVSDPKTMEKEMGVAISLLINSQSKREKLGISARQRIKDVFNWETKGLFMEKLFNEIESNDI